MKTLIGLFVVSLLLVPVASLANNHAVKIVAKDGIGNYLTDAEGKTLYWFKMDEPGKSACAGPCVEKWPLYHREPIAPPDGVPVSDFGKITRDDGKPQATFRGYPLYYFAGDAKAGDTNGHALKDIWYVIDPGNFPLK